MKYLFLFYLIFFQDGNDITIRDAWMRPAPESFNSAFYCTIINNSAKADTLYKASSNLSDDIELHETYMKGDMVGMRAVKNLIIAAHDSLMLKPGGNHIMFMNLKEKAVVNDAKDLTLYFRGAGELKVKASVITQH